MSTVQCGICSTIKAKNYLFTRCSHLICINCAALRVSDGVKCCGKLVDITHDVRKQLISKKEQILKNLSTSYHHQSSKLERLEDNFDNLLPEELMGEDDTKSALRNHILIQDSQGVSQREHNDEAEINEEMNSTPINQIYQCLGKKSPQLPKSYEKEKQNLSSLLVQQLNGQLKKIRCEFSLMQGLLREKEGLILNETKLYYEEYLKMLAQQRATNSTEINFRLESECLNLHFSKILKRHNFDALKGFFKQPLVDGLSKGAPEQGTEGHQAIQSPAKISGIHKLSSSQFEEGTAEINRQPIEEEAKQNNNPEPLPLSHESSRSLDKIYRKLEESKQKLEQRISQHHHFVSDRCAKV